MRIIAPFLRERSLDFVSTSRKVAQNENERIMRIQRTLLTCIITSSSVAQAFQKPFVNPALRKFAFVPSLQMSSESSFSTSSNPDVIPGRPTWHQTMLRIKDPQKSLEFYTKHLGFTHIDTFDFPQWKFSLYFLTTMPTGAPYNLQAGTQDAHDCLWNMAGTTLELTHNYGTETDESQKYHVGNEERDGTF